MAAAAEPESALLLDDIELDRERATRKFRWFVEDAWHLVRPADRYVDGFHIGAICEHLEAQTRGEIQDLVICIPPGCMKSLLVCVFWHAWEWTFAPQTSWMFGSHDSALSIRDALRTRRIFENPWYHARWGDLWRPMVGDEWKATKYSNDKGGTRYATSVGSSSIGFHADRQAIDDPIKPQDVQGSPQMARKACDKAWVWITEAMSTRLLKDATRTLIMQRLHQIDPAGRLIAGGDYETLVLPMEYEPKTMCTTSIGFEDPRTEQGELLFPGLFDRERVDKRKKDLGSRAAASQLQQHPSPLEGSIFKRSWIKYYYLPGFEHLADVGAVPLPAAHLLRKILSLDCSFKGNDDSDFVALHCWAHVEADSYLIDRIHERMGAADTIKAMATMSAAHPKAATKLVEDAANGAAVVDMLQKKIPGLILVSAAGGKVARARAVEPFFESGNVYLPHPECKAWAGDVVEELTTFPNSAHDDDVDATTHALARLHLDDTETYLQAMANLSGGNF